jgi:hypothetical protein
MMAPLNLIKAFAGATLKEYEPHWLGPAVWESEMADGVCSYDISILFGVAVRFFGLQSSATT